MLAQSFGNPMIASGRDSALIKASGIVDASLSSTRSIPLL